jgi:hypothetical protein
MQLVSFDCGGGMLWLFDFVCSNLLLPAAVGFPPL